MFLSPPARWGADVQPAATVYLAVNGVNGKRYVGVTRFSVAKRWGEHRARANMGLKSRFASAIRKYGAEQFTVDAIASCLSVEAASEVERAIIKQLAPEYNQTNGGEITTGRRVAPEVAARIAASNRGKKRTPEMNAKNSAAKKRQISENPEYRAKVMAALKKASASVDREKQRAAASASSRGRRMSDEARSKLSASCMGRRYSREVTERGAAKKRKPLICTTTGTAFLSCEEAAEKLRVSTSSIYKILAGARPSVGGMHFQYLKGEVSSPTARV